MIKLNKNKISYFNIVYYFISILFKKKHKKYYL